ncbi:histidine kinase dimerization/phosphoacceptor domain -containing protein [Tardiphaga sp. 839_C3_N1_4]|uniref:histidine kinase dimerization/phosphoacceptor domain -containing protein n=1 Tax=Tardiphaga sp. 839_C3_N1_4 TaxID=3240761 RepID=UPI003F1ECE15
MIAMPFVPPSIIPDNEVQRMAAVRRYDILDTPPDGTFDRVTALAARRFNVPISIISIVDHDRIWFKSHHGLAVEQIDRDPGLCASAILKSDPYILENAHTDVRSLTNPLVAGEFGLKFYMGVPLKTFDGYNLGTLCVIDKEPRTVDQSQIDDLKDLGSVVMDQMELRLSARRAVDQAQIMAREIDHRVMNSLQFVSAMLSLQSRSGTATDATTQLKIAADRVGAVARVHRHFYAEGVRETASCMPYIARLCADLSSILETPIHVSGDEGEVPTTSVQPIGLLINELVTNAAKHGAGQISVSFRLADGVRRLVISDLGQGLPADFSIESSQQGLGMKVIRSLAEQLGGHVEAIPNPIGRGSSFIVEFPA